MHNFVQINSGQCERFDECFFSQNTERENEAGIQKLGHILKCTNRQSICSE